MRRAATAIILAALADLAAQADIPYDAEVEYLGFAANQNIDTGIVPAQTDTYYLDYLTTSRSGHVGIWFSASGAWDGVPNKWLFWKVASTAPELTIWSIAKTATYIGGGAGGNLTDVRVNAVFSLRNRRFTATGGSKTFSGSLPVGGEPAANQPTIRMNNRASGRFYGWRIERNEDVIQDCIPVRFTNEQGVSEGAMFDRANPTVGMNPDGSPRTDGLYRNRGTGAFVVGPDVRVVAKRPRPPHLLSLLRTAADPTRMVNQPTTLDGGGWEGPCLFTSGGESAFTLCFWLRWRYTGDLSMGGLCAHSTISAAPARATAEGGPELPALLEVNCPLDASGDWSSSVSLPAGTETVNGRVVVCANITTDSATTLSVGGATVSLPASPSMQIRNLDVAVADVSAPLSVSVHTDPGAQVELALAINPWIEFKTLGGMFPNPTFDTNSPGSVTNDWALYALRGELAAGGRLTAVASLWHADGYRIAQTNALETSWAAGVFPADVRVRNSWSRVGGMGDDAPLDRYGIKAWPRRLADDELDRIYNLDRQELARRGLWDALPPSQANP